MDTTAKFIADIDAFQKRHGLTDLQFSRMATRDRSYVDRLRKGSGTNTKTMDRVRTWMREYDAAHPKPRRRSRSPAALVVAA